MESSDRIRVLVVSGQAHFLDWVAKQRIAECHLEFACSGASAFALLKNSPVDAVVLDGQLPDLQGSDLVRILMSAFSDLSVIANPSSGAGEFASLRVIHPKVKEIVARLNSAARPNSPSSSQGRFDFSGSRETWSVAEGDSSRMLPEVVAGSGSMLLVSKLVRLVAPRSTTVLLMGETGTGKERLAKAIHDLSPRRRNPFVVANCGAIPETLFESEMFGYERGAFTGAQQSHMGRVQAARGGTLFLDEVSELPLLAQAKLLRFLQEREAQRLGSNEATKVDVRVIAATNADLQNRVQSGSFRKDLFYRLHVFPIVLPPLRLRREDISLLAQHFLTNLCRDSGVAIKHFSAQTICAMKSYDWPGNVRELEHFVERAFIFSESSIEVHCEMSGPLHIDEPGKAIAGPPVVVPSSLSGRVAADESHLDSSYARVLHRRQTGSLH